MFSGESLRRIDDVQGGGKAQVSLRLSGQLPLVNNLVNSVRGLWTRWPLSRVYRGYGIGRIGTASQGVSRMFGPATVVHPGDPVAPISRLPQS